ncbi:MAG: metallophosphoesterase, partial [Flavipsychrobacter sp.]|nr:metallophosphoesterase [Flavipsychrobacter sp.]
LVLGTKAQAFFMPGNHDWANGKPQGYDNILRQSAYLNSIADNVKFYPEDGCPGPREIPLGKDAVLIIMDSQWWLTRGEKAGIESDCDTKTDDEILASIKDIIDHNQNKLVLFACHHPFRSTGVHSGYYGIKQHIFPFTDLNKKLYIPLPVIGSIYPISRGVFGSPQDLHFPLYANMIARVEDVLKTHPYVVHIAGHEHNLQLMSDSNYHYIVSGGGCKSQRVGHSKKTKYAAASMGFAVIDILKNRNVRVTFYEVNPEKNDIKNSYSETILNFSKFPELAKDTVTAHDIIYKDSVTVPANENYANASGFNRIMLGNNYRKEWATPVKFKVFDIKKEKGGMTIERLGGGKQSSVLHLKDKDGNKWVLRSLNKNPQNAIPKNFRQTFAGDVVQEMISANYPYAALCVPALSDALRIAHSNPRFFVVPDDYSLGRYRPLFANTVCMLEEHDAMPDEKSIGTFKLFNKLREKNNFTVDQQTLLKARMLDFLIADYDRHFDQWSWHKTDTGDRKQYFPIPHDRDEAFFYSDGLVLKYATWQRLPFLKGFRYDIPRVRWQGFVARYFDGAYLNDLDENEWKQVLNEFQQKITDSVISASVKNLPPEIAKMDSAVIVGKLKSRRDLLPERSLLYYKHISKRVNILGSNENEYFHVSKNGTGVSVDVYPIDSSGGQGKAIFSRKFDHKVTKELRLYGFNGDDLFRVDDDVHSKIKLRIIGGQGSDTFDMRGRVRNILYDFKKETNPVLSHRRTDNMFSKDPLVNNYNEKEDNYTSWRFPHLEAGYNPEDQVLLGVGIMQKTFNFRKKPYSTDQRLTSLFAIANKAYQVKYNGEFREVIKKEDILVSGEYVNPTLNNFFGFGNESKKDPNADIHFYRVRFTDLSGSVIARHRLFGDKLSIGLGPVFYNYYWNREHNSDRLLSSPAAIGLDSNSIFHNKSYAGGKLVLDVNNLNAVLFPTRGVDWVTTFTAMNGLNSNSKALTKMESDMAVYASLSEPAKVVAVLRIGGGHIFSNNYEYFQALTLGANNYLRGFRKDRFAGSSLLYGDIELRVKLCDVRSYILPGTLGIVGFNDAG